MVSLQDGSIFAGRFRIIKQIASGGMGAVYEVMHLETERRRALKVMHPHVLQSADLRERFKLEAKVAARIESEFVVDVVDASVDETTGVPYLVMELLRGEELGKRLKRVGRLAPDEVVMYLGQTARALEKSHRAAIVHRDLKPANLFLAEREEGQPIIKVLDFGIAKLVADSTNASATQSIGTPLYMAPEQFSVHLGISAATDIFALGMVAYTLLVGAPYWQDEQAAGNIFALTAVAAFGPREPASARAARRGVFLPPAFDWWFAKITAVDSAQRFASATDAVRALETALFGEKNELMPQASSRLSSADFPGAGASVSVPVSGWRVPVTVRLDTERANALMLETQLREKTANISQISARTQPTGVGTAVTRGNLKKPMRWPVGVFIMVLAAGGVAAGGALAIGVVKTPKSLVNGERLEPSAHEPAANSNSPASLSPPAPASVFAPAERLIELPETEEPSPKSVEQAPVAPVASSVASSRGPVDGTPPAQNAAPSHSAAKSAPTSRLPKDAVPGQAVSASGVSKPSPVSTSSTSGPKKKWLDGSRE